MPKLVWVLPSGKRNEALDGAVYALAALRILSLNLELLAEENNVFSPVYGKPGENQGRPRRRRPTSKGIEV